MCDPVSEHDSRGGGLYCCECNSWFDNKKKKWCCAKHRRKENEKVECRSPSPHD
jgi:hypothetical protein